MGEFKLHGSLNAVLFYHLVDLVTSGRVNPDNIKAPLYKSEYIRYAAYCAEMGAANGGSN